MPSSSSSDRVKRLQAQASRRERNRRLAIAGTAIAVVVVVVAALVIAKLASGGSSNDAASPPPQTGDQQVITQVTNVSPAVLNAVGAGTASNVPKAATNPTALTSEGKPLVLYVGGEFCPYCAATRWGVVVALSRFGTFTGLGQTSSSSSDVYPDTATLTFHGSSYTSTYVAFKGYELSDRNHQTLDVPPAADSAIFEKYDSPPYVPQAGSIPFVDIGGKYFLYGSAYDPQTLHGLSHEQIAGALSDPASPVTQAIGGEANIVTAAICQTTAQQPADVCTSAGVKAAATKLGASG